MVDKTDLALARKAPYPYNLIELVVQGAGYSTADGDDPPIEFTPLGIRGLIAESLTEIETQIIEMRYRDHKTLEEIGEAFGVSRERIRQREQRALRKMRHPARIKRYSAVPWHEYQEEKTARLKAESRLDWFLQHGRYVVALEKEDRPGNGNTVLDWGLAELELSVRSFNCLRRAGINTVRDIVKLTYEEIIEIRNLGRRSIEEITRKIHDLGLKMGWEE